MTNGCARTARSLLRLSVTRVFRHKIAYRLKGPIEWHSALARLVLLAFIIGRGGEVRLINYCRATYQIGGRKSAKSTRSDE